ncbi:MAG TPA: porin [Longimicrobiales bacterium]
MSGRVRARIALLLTLALAAPLAAQNPAANGLALTVSGYAQFQFNTTSVGEEDAADPGSIAASQFETRRVRLYADVAIDGWIEGRIQPEYAMGRFSLADVFMNFAVDPRFELRVGQFKRPFNRFYLIGSTQILTIERGIRIRGFDGTLAPSFATAPSPYTEVNGSPIHGEEQAILSAMGLVGRDIGVAAHGRLGRVAYEVAVFNGNGSDAPDGNDGKSLMARLAYSPLADAPLSIGAAASRREFYFDGTVDGVARDGADLSGTAFGVDVEWGRFRGSGVHALAELTTGDNLYVEDGRILGVQGMLAYLRPLTGARVEAIEVVGRASYGDPNTSRDRDHGMLFTPGVNIYFAGRNRLMLNWDVYVPGDDRLRTAHALRAQTQFYFGVPVPPPPVVAAAGSPQ